MMSYTAPTLGGSYDTRHLHSHSLHAYVWRQTKRITSADGGFRGGRAVND